MTKLKKEPWRIAVGIISVIFIIFMWIKNDIISIYTTMPKEQIVPMIATTVAVSVLKVAIITSVVLLVKWLIKKVEDK